MSLYYKKCNFYQRACCTNRFSVNFAQAKLQNSSYPATLGWHENNKYDLFNKLHNYKIPSFFLRGHPFGAAEAEQVGKSGVCA